MNVHRTTPVRLHSWSTVSEHDADQLKAAVHKTPVSTTIQGDLTTFKLYRGGVYNDKKCGKVLNHEVLIVGYGKNRDKSEYWLIKNSWGELWGQRGYAKILIKDGEGICGIQVNPLFPVV